MTTYILHTYCETRRNKWFMVTNRSNVRAMYQTLGWAREYLNAQFELIEGHPMCGVRIDLLRRLEEGDENFRKEVQDENAKVGQEVDLYC